MRNPDMWDPNGKPCLVVKSGNATGTTIGRANGVFSIIRDYFNGMSEAFSELVIRARQSPTSVAVSVACLLAVLVRQGPPI